MRADHLACPESLPHLALGPHNLPILALSIVERGGWYAVK